MDRSALKAVAEKWLRFWQGAGLHDFDEVHSPCFVDRSAAGRRSNREGFRRGIAGLYAAFPDFYGAADCFVIDEAANTVAIRWKATGTHEGVFLGIVPTHRRITFEGIEIIRIGGGQVVERWGEWNGIELMQQLGPQPTETGT